MIEYLKVGNCRYLVGMIGEARVYAIQYKELDEDGRDNTMGIIEFIGVDYVENYFHDSTIPNRPIFKKDDLKGMVDLGLVIYLKRDFVKFPKLTVIFNERTDMYDDDYDEIQRFRLKYGDYLVYILSEREVFLAHHSKEEFQIIQKIMDNDEKIRELYEEEDEDYEPSD